MWPLLFVAPSWGSIMHEPEDKIGAPDTELPHPRPDDLEPDWIDALMNMIPDIVAVVGFLMFALWLFSVFIGDGDAN